MFFPSKLLLISVPFDGQKHINAATKLYFITKLYTSFLFKKQND